MVEIKFNNWVDLVKETDNYYPVYDELTNTVRIRKETKKKIYTIEDLLSQGKSISQINQCLKKERINNMNKIKLNDNIIIAPEILNINLQCELIKDKYKLTYVCIRSRKETEILKKIKEIKSA